MNVLAARLDRDCLSRTVKPVQPGGRNGYRVHKRDGSVLAGRVFDRDIEPAAAVLLRPARLESQSQGTSLTFDPHEITTRGHIAHLETLGRDAAGDDRHAIEHHPAPRSGDLAKLGFTKARLTRMIT